jgi:internalin A
VLLSRVAYIICFVLWSFSAAACDAQFFLNQCRSQSPDLLRAQRLIFNEPQSCEQFCHYLETRTEVDLGCGDYQLRCDNTQQLYTIDWLREFTQLRSLNLSYHRIKDISVLTHLSKLSELRLNYNPIENFDALDFLPQLNMLSLRGVATLSDGVLLRLQNIFDELYQLDLSQTPVAHLSFLTHFPSLIYLDISYTGITDIAPLNNHTQWLALFLDGLPLKSFERLGDFPMLRILTVNKAQLRDMQGLQRYSGLQILSARHNQISELEPIKSLPFLYWLYVGDNRLANTSLHAMNHHMQVLDIEHNKITNLTPLNLFDAIQKVSIQGNPISHETCIQQIHEPKLRTKICDQLKTERLH